MNWSKNLNSNQRRSAVNADEKYMRLAISLAERAAGMTSPNPIVGAVVVKSGRIVGKGYHKRCGLPHAEINALKEAGVRARGATIYVTLEPCNHFGRTPPCTDAIIGSGIKRVVIGSPDPNPVNNGSGIKRLRKKGIKVDTGVLRKDAMDINKPFVKFITKKLPYITVKVAQSLDGKIATKTGDSRWISSEGSRRFVHSLRAVSDAVMAGIGTVIKDDPLLTVRSFPAKRHPVRIVVDSDLSISPRAKILLDAEDKPVVIAVKKSISKKKAAKITRPGVRLLMVSTDKNGLDLNDLMRKLAGMNISNILVEGGGNLIAGLFEKGLVDRCLFFTAPIIIGGRNAVTSVEGDGVKTIRNAIRLKNMKSINMAGDILTEAEVA